MIDARPQIPLRWGRTGGRGAVGLGGRKGRSRYGHLDFKTYSQRQRRKQARQRGFR